MMTDETVSLDGLVSLVENQEKGIEIDILNEHGKPLGLKIGIVGPDSDRMRKAMNEVAAAASKEAIERESLGDAAEGDSKDRMVDILAKATTHWTPNPTIAGKVIPFTEENVKNLYSRFRIIRDQVEAKAVRRASFTAGS